MNVLLVNPPGSASKKLSFDVCEILRHEYGWNVYVSYVKDNPPNKKKSYFHSYDEWVSLNREKINSTSLVDLEKKFNKSALWTIIVSQRTIYDYSYLSNAMPYYSPPLDQSNFLLKTLVLFYSELIEENYIDTVLAHAGDNAHSTTLFCLAPSMTFRVYLSNAVLFSNRLYYLCDDQYFRSSLLKKKYRFFLKNYDTLVKPNLNKIHSMWNKILRFDPVKEIKEIWRDTTIKSMVKDNFRSLRRFLSDQFTPTVGFEGVSRSKVFLLRMRSLLYRYYYYFYSEHFLNYERTIIKGPYVYYPLHLQPEATLLSTTPVYSDQLSLVRALSTSLPGGYKLVVKDYPLQAGYRPPYFYREIKKLPNVVLYHRSFPSPNLLDHCELIVTIQGTAGFEGILRGKKVLLFGKSIYEDIYGVHSVQDYKELHMILKSILFSPVDKKKQKESINAYIYALEEILYDPLEHPEYQDNEITSTAHRLKTLLEVQNKKVLDILKDTP